MASTDPLEALRGECQLVSDLVSELPEQDFGRPTRCTEWNVKELVAHMYRDVLRVFTGLSEPAPEVADTDSVTYWRAYAPVDDATDIADRAKEIAGQHEMGRDMAEAWNDLWQRSVALATTSDRERIVRTWRPTLTLDDLLRTRVLEITVHRMDLNAALGLPFDPTEAGLEITEEILLGLLGQAIPEGLGWDGPTFLDKGTGRADLTEGERGMLGDLADEFPLLS
jgi:uncharacterized protein (TIGR03083 family)